MTCGYYLETYSNPHQAISTNLHSKVLNKKLPTRNKEHIEENKTHFGVRQIWVQIRAQLFNVYGTLNNSSLSFPICNDAGRQDYLPQRSALQFNGTEMVIFSLNLFLSISLDYFNFLTSYNHPPHHFPATIIIQMLVYSTP